MNTIMLTIIISVLTAAIGGLIGTYFGARFMRIPEEKNKKNIREIAIKALDIIAKYAKKSYREAENEFNNTLSITEKRTVIVALHKLGIPFGVPYNELFNIKKIYFVDKEIDKEEIDGIIMQINNGYCDNLFYLDPDTYFASNYTLFAMRNAGKRYVSEILSKSKVDVEKNILIEPVDLGQVFSLGEFKAIQVLRDQVRDQMYFDKNGQPIQEKINSLIRDIELGLWDSYLMWNYEAYQNTRIQIQMGQLMNGMATKQTSTSTQKVQIEG